MGHSSEILLTMPCACALQGLANLDPDVDAIYRLTQSLDVHFKAEQPAVALPRSVVCPWNSQNTLFAQDALWGLLIPVTTTFRVCDIWRRSVQRAFQLSVRNVCHLY